MRLKQLLVAVQLCLAATSPHAISQMVISQVYGGGGNSGAVYRNDFIELLNAGRDSMNLTGWSVQYASATGGTWQVTTLSGSVAPGYYYLIQEAQGSGGTTDLPSPDAIGTIAMAATSGKVALVSSTVALSGSCPPSGEIHDLVGYGSATCFEGSGPAPSPGNTVAATRKNGGGTDTQDNQADFLTAAPNPRNVQYPPLPVQLVAFSAILTPPHVQLDWATATEIDNFGFYVQRAEAVGTLLDIPGAFVPGNGTTNIPHLYSWLDSTTLRGSLRYRLRQVDLDGCEHFSPEVSIDAAPLAVTVSSGTAAGSLVVWPNPFNPLTNVCYSVVSRSEAKVTIRDLLGREIRSLAEGLHEPGAYTVRLDGRGLSSGTYFCTLQTPVMFLVKKVLLIR